LVAIYVEVVVRDELRDREPKVALTGRGPSPGGGINGEELGTGQPCCGRASDRIWWRNFPILSGFRYLLVSQ
jgi:hypothetical protein